MTANALHGAIDAEKTPNTADHPPDAGLSGRPRRAIDRSIAAIDPDSAGGCGFGHAPEPHGICRAKQAAGACRLGGEYRRASPGGGGLASVHPSGRNSCASSCGRQARTHVFHRTVGECRVSVRGCASGLHRDAVFRGISRPALAWHGVGAVVDIVAMLFPGVFLSGVAARSLDRQDGHVADCGAGEGQPVTPVRGGHVARAAVAAVGGCSDLSAAGAAGAGHLVLSVYGHIDLCFHFGFRDVDS